MGIHNRFFQPLNKSFKRAINWYSTSLEKRPFVTQMATSGILGGLADVITQHLEHRWDQAEGNPPKAWNMRRLASVTAFGIFGMGPFGHIWYLWLDRFCLRFCRSQTSMITTKVCGDTFLFGPFALWTFFASVSLMEGMSWKDVRSKLRREFVPTYIIDYSMWPIVQFLNFRFIPVPHQLMFVNSACVLDDCFLTYIEHNGLPRMFIGIERWWGKKIGEPLPETEQQYNELKKAERSHAHATDNSSTGGATTSYTADEYICGSNVRNIGTRTSDDCSTNII